MRVLFIDDSGSSRAVLKALFRKFDPEVVIKRARDGQTALEVFDSEQEDFDYITIDLYMPGMDGFEVAERLAERESTASIALITGDNDVELRERAKKQGLLFMTKPITEAKIRELFSIS